MQYYNNLIFDFTTATTKTMPLILFQKLPEESLTKVEFVDATVGMNIPKSFIPSIEKVVLSALPIFSLNIVKENAIHIYTIYMLCSKHSYSYVSILEIHFQPLFHMVTNNSNSSIFGHMAKPV